MADVFLSYSQADNFYPTDWVDRFHYSLEKMTMVTAGRRNFTIWKDTRDRTGNDLEQSIKDALAGAKFLLTLVSPLYFEDASGWCKKERDYFVDEVVGDPNLAKSRIITALKSFDEKEDEFQMPEELKNQFRYKLYKLTANKVPRPIEPTDPEWNDCLLTIAYTLKKELRRLEQANAIPNANCVFLASSREQYDDQLRLAAELESWGYRVKTLFPNIKNVNAWKKEFQETLNSCKISIHLFGQKYEAKSGINISLEEHQWRWAIEQSSQTNIKVLSWIEKGVPIIDQQQAHLIDSIKSDNDLPTGHDFMEKTFEEFLGSIKDYLTA
jgi:hypothetical protein